MVDHTPTDETVLRQPAAPLSPQDIAEMRARVRAATDPDSEFVRDSLYYHLGRWDGEFYANARTDMPRLLDAIEELTAKNQRLTDALNTSVLEACEEIDDRLKPEIERLTAENARLTSERDAIKEGFSELLSKYFADFGQAYQPEHYATTDHGWYATQRTKVEAAHAAAKEAKRDAQREEDDAALSVVAMSFLAESVGADIEKMC